MQLRNETKYLSPNQYLNFNAFDDYQANFLRSTDHLTLFHPKKIHRLKNVARMCVSVVWEDEHII